MEPNKDDTVTAEELLNQVNNEILFFNKCSNNKDMNSCTYSKGYHSQEIFSCLTCYRDTNKYAALCVGCAFNCHKEHDVIELYFKRHIRCDCGNSKFIIPCNYEEKQYENEENIYNRNYEARYCYCNKDEAEGNMIQCVICEDWYHEDHLSIQEKNQKFPETNEEVNLLCRLCLGKMKFLEDYPINDFIVNTAATRESQETPTRKRKHSDLDQAYKPYELSNKKFKSNDGKPESLVCDGEKETSNFKTSQKEESNEDISSISCQRELLRSEVNKERFNTIQNYDILVNIKSLISLICKCSSCMKQYTDISISFLCDKDYYTDFISRTRFVEKIEEEIEEDSDENKNILNKINEVNLFQLNDIKQLDVEKQMALSMVMRKFTEEFGDFISKLKPENGVVTKEHVEAFLINFRKDNPLLNDLN